MLFSYFYVGLSAVNVNVNVNVNAKTAIAKRLAVQIMKQDRIYETKKFLADDEKQSETRKR